MLNCKEILEKSSDYVDGELSFWGRIQVWYHLMMCSICRTFIRQFKISVRSVEYSDHAQGPDEQQLEDILAKINSEKDQAASD